MIRLVPCMVIFFVAAALSGGVAILSAQENGPRAVTSPFQEEMEIQVGEILTIEVSVDGVLWRNLRINGGDPADFVSGKTVKTVVTTEMENLGEETMVFESVLLLEDRNGRQLHRITLRPIKVGGGRFKEDSQKFKVDGRTLAETAKVYIFAEVK